ncbi:MAG: transposase [Cytophagales bacterium]|nr:transposase [Cytophagales bacterium]
MTPSTRGLEKLSKQKDPLVKLLQMIEWEQFRPILERIFKKEMKGKGGRTPYDYVMMFKTLILQRYYNLSDDQIAYQILDRLSFMRFLSLNLSDKVPDSKTVWNFRERLTKAGKVEAMFDKFNEVLAEKGLLCEIHGISMS